MTKRGAFLVVLLALTIVLAAVGVVIARGRAAPNVQTTALGTAFTYQGHLTDSGGAVTDTCDLRFGLYDALSGGSQIGSTLDKSSVSVDTGLFSTQLDYGSSAFNGDDRYLETEVRVLRAAGRTRA